MTYCVNCGATLSTSARFCPVCGKAVVIIESGGSQATASQYSAQPTTTTVRYSSHFASLSDRFAAQLVDGLILAIVSIVIFLPFGFAAFILNPLGWAFASSWYSGLSWLFWIVIPVLYFSYFESTSGQTIGKSLMSIKVVDLTSGSQIDFGRALIRNLLRLVDFLPLLYLVGVIMMASTERKQRLGDLAANTVVIKIS
jgi:uncharacterized RDD family membrane protein YckC